MDTGTLYFKVTKLSCCLQDLKHSQSQIKQTENNINFLLRVNRQ